MRLSDEQARAARKAEKAGKVGYGKAVPGLPLLKARGGEAKPDGGPQADGGTKFLVTPRPPQGLPATPTPANLPARVVHRRVVDEQIHYLIPCEAHIVDLPDGTKQHVYVFKSDAPPDWLRQIAEGRTPDSLLEGQSGGTGLLPPFGMASPPQAYAPQASPIWQPNYERTYESREAAAERDLVARRLVAEAFAPAADNEQGDSAADSAQPY